MFRECGSIYDGEVGLQSGSLFGHGGDPICGEMGKELMITALPNFFLKPHRPFSGESSISAKNLILSWLGGFLPLIAKNYSTSSYLTSELTQFLRG